MKSWTRPLASLLCGLLVVGCFSDVGAGSGGDSATSSSTNAGGSTSDEGTSSADTGTTQAFLDSSSTFGTWGTFGTTSTFGSTEVGPEACGPSEECVDDDLPGGWTGPFLVHAYPPGEAGPPCPAQWSEVGGAPTFADLQDMPLACDCTCGGGLPINCDFALSAYMEPMCGGMDTPVTVTPDCTVLPTGTLAASATATASVVGECGPGTATGVGPAPFASRIRVCEPERSENTCEGGECLTLLDTPPTTQLCIAEGGEQSCDNLGPFTERHVAYASFTDDRECESGCSCDAAPVCVAELTVTPGDDCLGFGASGSLGQCVNGAGGGAAFTGGANNAPCEGPGSPYPSTGASTPEGTPTTYCCMAPS